MLDYGASGRHLGVAHDHCYYTIINASPVVGIQAEPRLFPMFTFTGYVDRRQFLRAAALRIGLFLAGVIGFPLLLHLVSQAFDCRIHAPCGVVEVLRSVALGPLFFVLLVFSFAGISMRRVRDAGAPAWIGLAIPLLLLADSQFLIFAGGLWLRTFLSGPASPIFPSYMLLALLCIAVLCILRSRDDPQGGNPFGATGWLALGLLLCIALFIAFSAASAVPGIGTISLLIARPPAARLLPYVMFAVAAFLTWIAARDLLGPAAEPVRRVTEPRPAAPLSMILVTVAAMIATIMAFLIGPRADISPVKLLFSQLIPIALPTFVIYFCLLLATSFVIARPKPTSLAAFVLSLLPFLHWGYAHWKTAEEHQQEAAAIAAIATVPVTRQPGTLVVSSTGIHHAAVWALPGIERMIVKHYAAPGYIQFARPKNERSTSEQTTIASLPAEYLLLLIGGNSSFAKSRQGYAAAGGPFELRQVDSGRDDLVAVWYQTWNPSPPIMPLLSMNGWFRGMITGDDISVAIRAFLTKALDPARRTAAGPKS